MTFWDQVGKGWEWSKHTVASIGGAISAANDDITSDIDNSGFGQFWRNTLHNPKTGDPFYEPVLNFMQEKPIEGLNLAKRAVSADLLMSDRADGVSFFDPNAWRKAWNLTDVHEVAPGKTVEGISIGQQIFGDATRKLGGRDTLSATSNLQDSPETAAARQDLYHDTWWGKLGSGSIDAFATIKLDPLNVGMGLAAEAKNAARVIKPGTADAVMDAARGGAPLTNRIGRQGAHVREFADWAKTGEKSSAEIANHPMLRQNNEKGTFGVLINEAKDTQDVHHLIGAAIGSPESIAALRAKNADLYNEVRAIVDPPAQTKNLPNFKWNDHGQGMMDVANMDLDYELSLRRDEIMEEIDRLDRAIAARGQTIRTSPTFNIRGQGLVHDDGLNVSTLRSGPFARPIVVVKGMLGSRLEHHVEVANASRGYDQLDETLRQCPYITGAERNEFLSNFARAVGGDERKNIVQAANARIIESTAVVGYGRSVEEGKAILEMATGRANVMRKAWQKRLYTAQPGDKYVAVADPENGLIVAQETARLRTQIEDAEFISDPRLVDRFMRSGTKNRLLDDMLRFELGHKVGQKTADVIHGVTDPIKEIASDRLIWATKFWKDLQLIPRTPAYMIRQQIDSQLRLASYLGGATYAAEAKDIARMAMKVGKSSLGRPFKVPFGGKGFEDADYDRVLRPYLQSKMFDGERMFADEDIEQIISNVRATGGSHANLADELSNGMLQKLRATGNWKKYTADDPEHMQSFLRVVNMQLRGSPTAAAVATMTNMTRKEMAQWVMKNPEARREWLELSKSWHHDMDAWLQALSGDVSHYLPTAEMREIAFGSPTLTGEKVKLGRNVTEADYGKFFDVENGGVKKMAVHGESFTATEKSKFADWYDDMRNRMYSLISEAPENTLARMPLYVQEFDRNLRRMVASHGSDVVDAAEMMNYRVQADRLARRNLKAVLFDSSDVTNLAHTMRHVAPFFAAWEDVIKKWGNLFFENPAHLERFMVGWQTPNAMGMVQDAHGNQVDASGRHWHDGQLVTEAALKDDDESFVIPLSFLKDPRTGKSMALRARKGSFNSVFQGEKWWAPGFGPLVQVPVNEAVKRAFPGAETNPIMQYLLPFGTTDKGVADQSIPSWAKQLHNAAGAAGLFTTDEFKSQSTRFAQEAQVRYEFDREKWIAGGKVGPGPKKPDLDAVSRKTGLWFMVRAAMGLSLPFTVTPTPEMQFYQDQWHYLQQKYGSVQSTPEYHALKEEYAKLYGKTNAEAHLLQDHPEYKSAIDRFTEKFPEFYDLTVSGTADEYGFKMNLETVSAAQQFKKEISGLKDKSFAWAIAGPDTAYGLDPNHTYSNASSDWMKVNGYRRQMDAKEALGQGEVAKGWKDYMAVRTALNLELERRGLHSLSQKGAEDLREVKRNFILQMRGYNEDWSNDYGHREDNLIPFLQQMQGAMGKNKKLAERPDMKALSDYLMVRQVYRAELDKRRLSSLESKGAEDLSYAWDNFVASMRQQTPGFEQIWNRMLDNDTITEGVPVSD